MKTKKTALGRGLSAILESPETDITSRDISGEFVVGAIAHIDIHKIEANPFQPRTEFEAERLNELAESIKQQGIIQPITVRKMGYDKYQLISGERRLRASRIIGLETIPAYIRVADDEQMLEMALIENIHRDDLNALEIALSYHRLIEELQISINDLAEKVGQNRSTIANYIRLLKLPTEVQVAIRDGQISMGHARAIINVQDIEDQLIILKETIEKGLSVREVEKWVRDLQNAVNQPDTEKPQKKSGNTNSPVIDNITETLSRRFAAAVDITRNTKGKGQIVIRFKNEDEFNRILNLLQ
jgi:ParB family chromosome partitioning protein